MSLCIYLLGKFIYKSITLIKMVMNLINLEDISKIYRNSYARIMNYTKKNNRPLTLTEKILIGHIPEMPNKLKCGESYIFMKPDRVALQDVTGQMTILQFMQTKLKSTKVHTTIHCDHLIRAKSNDEYDTHESIIENKEVFEFLESACGKYSIGFWKPGAGIIHQVVFENYAFPGGFMIGTDSHTPNAGGLGMLSMGVGGMDAAETMAGLLLHILYPKRIGVHLIGKLNGWAAPKDIILYIAQKLKVSGGTNSIIEYFGCGIKSISCTGKATITNMGAEIGATSSIFPYDERMEIYLRSTGRNNIAELASMNKKLLVSDQEIEENPTKYFDQVIELDLSLLEPHITGPHTPDLSRSISSVVNDIKINKYVNIISSALIGSCTNSSYEDMSQAADLAKQAKLKGIKIKIPLLITPGSKQIKTTMERDGQLNILRSIGATVLANACGPCIGQWKRNITDTDNTIVTSFNRNFPGRNDGKTATMNFIGSPQIIVALALAGNLSFNPIKDNLLTIDGAKVKLDPPNTQSEVPPIGFTQINESYIPPSKNKNKQIILNVNSTRLQKITPFDEWDGADYTHLFILAKVKGKCTTDHISPAGPWLTYRGHLDKLSDNMLLGATNYYNDKIGKGINALTGELEFYSQIARQYKSKKIRWVIIGENNYGEGSSREHAAMSPRYLGCVVIIAKSFARIHENNLKKQGILALKFTNAQDYYKICERDQLDIVGLNEIRPGKAVKCLITNQNKSETIFLSHSYDDLQLNWFRSGSALNVIKSTAEH